MYQQGGKSLISLLHKFWVDEKIEVEIANSRISNNKM